MPFRGVFSNLTNLFGVFLSLVIWSTAEGFGAPYHSGSTDIGAAVIYVLVFTGLFLSSAGLYLGLDRRLTPALGRLGILAAGTWYPASANVARKLAAWSTMTYLGFGWGDRRRQGAVHPAA
jgi:hypothetical protein